jgi:hypothetical protein
LYTLEGLNGLEPGFVERALSDEHYGVRVHALRLAERWLDRSPSLLAKVVWLAEDAHPKVRLQLAFSLGERKDEKALQALARLARREGNDRWMQAAIVSAVPTRAGQLAAALISQRDELGNAARLLHPLALVVGARNQPTEIAPLLQGVAALSREEDTAIQVKLLTGLLDGLGRGQSRPEVTPQMQQALERLLERPSRDIQMLVLRIAGVIRLSSTRHLKTPFIRVNIR